MPGRARPAGSGSRDPGARILRGRRGAAGLADRRVRGRDDAGRARRVARAGPGPARPAEALERSRGSVPGRRSAPASSATSATCSWRRARSPPPAWSCAACCSSRPSLARPSSRRAEPSRARRTGRSGWCSRTEAPCSSRAATSSSSASRPLHAPVPASEPSQLSQAEQLAGATLTSCPARTQLVPSENDKLPRAELELHRRFAFTLATLVFGSWPSRSS